MKTKVRTVTREELLARRAEILDELGLTEDELTEKAAALGSREALTFVGVRRMQAYAQGISDDPSDALKWLERAAELNEPTAMLTLSMYYTEFAARSGQANVAKGVGLLKQCVDRTAHHTCMVLKLVIPVNVMLDPGHDVS